MTFAGKLKDFASDRGGAVAITSALLMTALIGFTALGVDVGSIYTDRRKAQSVADLAALAAVANLGDADKAAAATIASNKLMNPSYTLQYGVYTADPAIAPGNRFAPSSAANANAARVVLNTLTPLFFARVVTGKDTSPSAAPPRRRKARSSISPSARVCCRWTAACSMQCSARCSALICHCR